jgi:heme exporter protein C
MKNWWKYTSAVLLIYVVVVSLMVPLSPGISDVSNSSLSQGNNSNLKVFGYNTDFYAITKGLESPNAWVTCSLSPTKETGRICATNEKVNSENELSFDLDIPDALPSPNLTLYIQYGEGVLRLQNAFSVSGTTTDSLASPECKVADAAYLPAGYVFPNREMLYESIRNLMFHVPMWFAMMLIMTISFIWSLRYLRTFDAKYDLYARQAVTVGLVFGILGLITGSVWARVTWGHWWSLDTKLNGAAITTLIYFAYMILRGSVNEEQNKARIAAVYNIFAYVILIVMLMVLPRMMDTLHPGSGGNPGFNVYDLDDNLRKVFYPAVLGWIGLSIWFMQIRIRLEKLKIRMDDE